MPLTIDTTLRQISRQTEEHAAQQLAARSGMTYAVLDNYPFTLEALSLIPLEVTSSQQIATYLRSGDKIRVAVVHPENPETGKALQEYANTWKTDIEATLVSRSSMDFLVKSYLELIAEAEASKKEQILEQIQKDQKDYYHNIRTLEDLKLEASRVSVTELLDVILAAAFNQHASDIHFEPGDSQLTIRFRIDGVLRRVLDLPMAQHHGIVSRIKIMSSVKLDGQEGTQDGRFSLLEKGINADVRVSTIPTGYGEGIVMRILRQDMRALSIQELGFSQYNQALIEKMIRRPYGLILVTGPTGSGKSTTMYALLQLLNSTEKKIITLEDPIEYRIDGLQQSQIDPDKGFTFAEGLRGALRQDPDVVMVGEIRDPETATIALNASLTGHLVLSTLHTNNAITASTRFLEMGIAPFLLSGSIQMIIAQRLVRKVSHASGSVSADEDPEFSGRIVIAEVLTPNQEFEQAVISHKDQMTLEQIAIKGGMVPMIQDGLDKVKRGLTTESEIYRVTTV
jgi:type IV pilus assembly protein PilB